MGIKCAWSHTDLIFPCLGPVFPVMVSVWQLPVCPTCLSVSVSQLRGRADGRVCCSSVSDGPRSEEVYDRRSSAIRKQTFCDHTTRTGGATHSHSKTKNDSHVHIETWADLRQTSRLTLTPEDRKRTLQNVCDHKSGKWESWWFSLLLLPLLSRWGQCWGGPDQNLNCEEGAGVTVGLFQKWTSLLH